MAEIRQANCDDCGQVGVPVIIAGVQCGWRGQRDGRDFAKDNKGGRICRTCWDKYDREAKEEEIKRLRHARSKEYLATVPEPYRDAKVSDASSEIQEAVKRWEANKAMRFLYLGGSAGIGKTRVAWAIVIENELGLINGEVKHPTMWIDMPVLGIELLGLSIQDRAQREGEITKFDGILVLDDFGNEVPLVRRELYPVIQYRSQRSLRTIFTSEYSIEDLILMEGYGQRWASRIANGEYLFVDGPDHRLREMTEADYGDD